MKIEMPSEVYVLTEEAKDLLRAFGVVTEDDELAKNIDIWFYDCEFFEKYHPEELRLLQKFLTKVKPF